MASLKPIFTTLLIVGAAVLAISEYALAQQLTPEQLREKQKQQQQRQQPRPQPQQQQQLRAPPAGRPNVANPQQQMTRPGQAAPNQRVVGRPGGTAVIAKPGVIRGPAGSLRKARPANVVYNPLHRIGRTGGRYNRQAFVFGRGHFRFRRAYYLGPAGAIFFYDEALPENDASYALDENAIPSCPEDADDCQGLDQSDETAAQVDPKAEALQYLMSLMPNVAWGQEGLMISGDDDDVLVAYGNLEVTVNHYLPFGAGPEQLFVGTGGLMGTGVRIYSGSYDQNKAEWNKVIIALRKLGVRAATPSGPDRDIRSIQ
jgi:hypothetical protein